MSISDEKLREEALDPSQSFIVQAPAGSGKTGLLTLRFLVLLTQVEKVPEECLSLTFTRKAASEMRDRILAALERALSPLPPDNAYENKIWQLARQVLERDRQLGWNLIENSQRLRILTIDALCASLTRQMPIMSKLGASLKISDRPSKLYEMAAKQLLTALETEESWSTSVRKLLAYLDNNWALAERLLANMLQTRDQWLPHIGSTCAQTEIRFVLEMGLQMAIEDILLAAQSSLPNDSDVLLELASFAAEQLEKSPESQSLILNCKNITRDCLRSETSNLERWQGIAELLLTKDHQWRKTITLQQGFPAPSATMDKTDKIFFKKMKQTMGDFLETHKENEPFRAVLEQIRICPPSAYQESEWEIIEALVTLLPMLVAELSVVFQEQGQMDFIEVSLAALRSLGDEEAPTDLALSLDYKIKHVLVDEFQDTSIPQFRLLERLTMGWQPGDGRTLFLVGDPMQSIYRFRQAEVGLFIRSKQKGLGNIPLKSINLTTNFRSDPKIIEWVNQTFENIFPKQNNINTGAINYALSYAAKLPDLNSAVMTESVTEETESTIIVDLLQTLKKERPRESMALLVRSRNHLKHILPALRKAEIEYNGIQLELLGERPIVQDLLALTRALLHLGDKIAWLAILRTPWFNLSLQDLFHIANFVHAETKPIQPIWYALDHYSEIAFLREEAKCILEKKVPILRNAIKQQGRLSLRDYVMETWLALEGAQFFYDVNSITDAETFFTLLDEPLDFSELNVLEERLQSLYAKPKAVVQNALQIMTIHKAKGLEFDVVIVPGLGKRTNSDSAKLLLFGERTRLKYNDSYLLLAPIKSVGAETLAIYHYLKKQEEQRAYYESLRLLYVAATRAKKQLYWLSQEAKYFSGFL